MSSGSLEKMQSDDTQTVPVPGEKAPTDPSAEQTDRPSSLHLLNARPALLSALLLLLTFVTFQPALECGFIWDDECLTQNVWIRSPSGLAKLWTGAVLAPKDERWWPVNYTVFAVLYQVWGLKAAGYHLLNVLLHGLNGVLVFRLLRRHLVPGAWLAGALFIVHPAHGQSAAWIMDIKTLLSTSFCLLSLGLYLDFLERRRWGSWALSLLFFSLAMLTKASVLVLPAALLPLIWWKKGRLERRDILEMLPMLGLGVGLYLLGSALTRSIYHYEDPRLGVVERVLVAGQAFWYYIRQFVWPVDLMMIPPRWKVDAGAAVQYLYPLAALLAGGGIWFRFRRSGKGVVVALLFFALCLLPTLGLVRFSYQRLSFVASRYGYLADIGLVALVGAGIAQVYRAKGARTRLLVVAGATAMMAVAGFLSWSQTRAFQNNITLFTRDLRIDPSSWGARYTLAVTLVQEGRLEEAGNQLEKVVMAEPTFTNALVALGHTKWQTGRQQEGIRRLEEAVQSDPASSLAHYNLGIYQAEAGERRAGLRHLERAVQLEPRNADIHLTLGAYLAEDGRTSEALIRFREAVRLSPENASARHNLQKLQAERSTVPARDR